MRDEIDSRMWLQHHEEFHAFVGRAISGIRDISLQLRDHLFRAPWDGDQAAARDLPVVARRTSACRDKA